MGNQMLAPLTRLKLSGMVWDQGEANTKDPPLYTRCFPAAIAGWRRQFKQPELPFLFVQIGPSSSGRLTDPFGARNDSYVRRQQLPARRRFVAPLPATTALVG